MTTRAAFKEKNRLYHYVAHVTAVYDGDTITVDLDLGLGLWRHDQTIRLWKIDTPEVRGPNREQALMVRDYLRSLVLDKTILLRTILDKRGDDKTGKFGRLLGELLIEDDDGDLVNVNQRLLDQGYAVPLGADGSHVQPAALPQPGPATGPAAVLCPYCGELRTVTAGLVAVCPNCLDAAFLRPANLITQ